MRRIPIQIDEETYRALKRRAFEEGRSIAAIVRDSLSRMSAHRPRTIDDFVFVGSGEGKGDARSRVSERHDQALADAFSPRRRKRR